MEGYMLKLKTSVTERVVLDDITFEIRALTREEFLTYTKKLSEFTNDETGNIENPEEMYNLMLEVIEVAIDTKDETLKRAIMEKITEAPAVVQNKLFERIMQLSTTGK